MDALILSRIQFALTSGFHYIYPPLSIGLGLLIVIMEATYLKTRDPVYKSMTKFWVKIFALTFALGVATGLVQVFGFGTNWARYSRYVGDVFGSALGAEGIFAFFLEAGFLGVMLFGWNRVSEKMHFVASSLVCLGAHFSSVWIVIANSWMQTPRGFEIVPDGTGERAVVTNFWEMLFNPSSVDRLTHVIIGCWLTGIFLVLSVAAYYMLKGRHKPFTKRTMKMGLYAAAVVLLLQLASADSTARGVAKNQPAKLAAMEGVYKTSEGGTGIYIAGMVDAKNKKVTGIQIPKMLSLLTNRSLNKPVTGLDKIPEDEWPNVPFVFQAYHMMVGMWFLMTFIVVAAIIQMKRGKLEKSKLLLWSLILSVGLPHIANQTGWITAEAGRQPWVVWGLLRTKDGVSEHLSAGQVWGSILMFLTIFALLFFLFIYILNEKIQHGPEELEDADAPPYRNPYGSQS